jgi:hypothetical protein
MPTPDDYRGPWSFSVLSGAVQRFDKFEEFGSALRAALTDAIDIERLFAIWEHNVDTVRLINKTNSKTRSVLAQDLVAHLKSCAIALAKQGSGSAPHPSPHTQDTLSRTPEDGSVLEDAVCRTRIDKSLLAIAEPKRIRSKEHLRFVASQACLICGRTPAQAHHIRYAQPRGIALKVSDEFTVPLCAIHHSENHTTGDERNWWEKRKIDPLAVAQELWRATAGMKDSTG